MYVREWATTRNVRLQDLKVLKIQQAIDDQPLCPPAEIPVRQVQSQELTPSLPSDCLAH
jgi:hypothetical protein